MMRVASEQLQMHRGDDQLRETWVQDCIGKFTKRVMVGRDLTDDTFCQSLGVVPEECEVAAWMWQLPLTDVWASFGRAALG